MKPEMFAYLDTPYDRSGTDCLKWDCLEECYGRRDLTAMWVADMDFPTVPQVRDALVRRAEHAIYGYTVNARQVKAAEVDWQARRHGLQVEPEWILYSPGVVDSLFFCVQALTSPGDGVVIQPPVYGPFFDAISAQDRKVVEAPLTLDADGWRMDYAALERAFAQAKLMILCSPHNPVGRVWTEEELARLVELAKRYGVVIVSDEIHGDFALDGRRHVRIMNVPGARDISVLLSSATKSFNLAGLRQSSIIVADEKLREAIEKQLRRAHTDPNIFGSIAQMTAHTFGDEWMDAVVEYVQGNRDFLVEGIRAQLPELKCRPQEGTYLLWVDFRALGMPQKEMERLLVEKGGVALTSGTAFGAQGEGWFRVNLATHRVNVERTLEHLRKAIQGR